MFAIIAAVLFGLALLLDLIHTSFDVITPTLLVIAGLLSLALYLAGLGSSGRYYRGRRPGRG